MFDAGSIQASLSIDTAKADADLRKIEDRVKKLEDTKHVIKISAVFDNASMSAARKAFTNLDNLISRDAMQRLRSSPQGSVLGTLNALFSPHPVTGAPTAQQAAGKGLLGQMATQQGGVAASKIIAGATPGGSTTTTTRIVQQGGGGNSADSQALRDAARDIKTAASDVKGSADDIGNAADDMHGAATDLRAATTGIRGVITSLHSVFGTGGGGGGGRGLTGFVSGHAGPFSAGLASGIGPGILGLNAKTAGIVGLGGSLLGALPAVGAIGATLGIAGAGTSVIAAGAKSLIGTKNTAQNPNAQGPLFNQAQAVGTALQDTLKTAATGMLAPLKQAFGEIPGLLKGIAPALKSVFAGAGTLIQPLLMGLDDIAKDVLPALGQAFRAVAPLLRPLLDGLGQLLKGLLPGITTLLRAAMPAIQAFAQVLGTLGRDLGKMFADFAPAITASVQIFKPLMDILAALFPIVGKLAAVFAQALGPVFTQFAGVVKALLPALTIIGDVLSKLAGAVLGDLVSAFTAVASLIKAIAPALAQFALAFSNVFTVLENTGIFATLGDALENLVTPLAALINAILKGLTPILPPVIQALSQLSSIMVGALTQAIGAILPPLTQLATVALQALAKVLPVILPVLTEVLGLFAGGVADAITGVAKALGAIITAIPPGVLQGIVIAIGGIVAAVKLWAAAQAILNVALDANPIGLVAIALAAIGVAFYEAWQKSAGFRQAIKDIGAAFLQAGIVIVEANKYIVGAFLDMVSVILHGAADAFGWVPGIGPKLKDAAASFDDFKNHVNNGFNDAIKTMQGWQNQLLGTAPTFDQVSARIEADFGNQQKAAGNATTALNAYTSAIQQNGVNSDAAKGARQQLITDLINAGVKSGTAQTDVASYTAAVTQNGVSSDAAGAARRQLVTDILNASNNALQGRTDLASYTTAVQQNGANSDAARSARQRLITDLTNAGVSSKTAKTLVDNLGTSIKNLPAGKTIKISMDGTGLYTITGSAVLKSQGAGGSGNAAGGLATGGQITQGTTPTADDVPIMASKGEWVIQESSSSKYGPAAMNAVNQGTAVIGYATGGQVGGNLTPGFIDGMYNTFQSKMTAAMVAAMRGAIKSAEAAAAAAAAAGGGAYLGAGSANYAADITTVLKSMGLPLSLVANWLRQIQTESGGNLSAVNRTDSNAAAGHPSVGLLQLIPGTFHAYAGPYVNTPPLVNEGGGTVSLNPMAQIYAAIHYAAATYNGAAMAGVIGQGHGYAAGGPVMGFAKGGTVWEPVTGYGHLSGRVYQFAEHGPEHITPGAGMGGDKSAMLLSRICTQLDQLTGVAAAIPQGTGEHVGAALGGAAQSASFRRRFPTGGA